MLVGLFCSPVMIGNNPALYATLALFFNRKRSKVSDIIDTQKDTDRERRTKRKTDRQADRQTDRERQTYRR